MTGDASSSPSPEHRWVVDLTTASLRLDVFLSRQIPEVSRTRLRRAIQEGNARVDGARAKAAYRLNAGQVVTLGPLQAPRDTPEPEPIPLDLLYEDEHLVAIDKPAGMVVHPAKGNWGGTLANALAWHFRELSGVGGITRPGIVHRLDRETSGVLLVAKTDDAHHHLARQFSDRTVRKQYMAWVQGEPDRDRDVIERAIGPHPYQREKMAIRDSHATSRPAETYYEVSARFGGFARLDVFPRTGRTHQIRVHLAHVGCPVLCDRLYGGRSRIGRSELLNLEPAKVDSSADTLVLTRHALHAWRLECVHPVTGEPLTFTAPLPDDLVLLDELLQQRLA